MPRLSLRRGMWAALAVLTVVVCGGSAYLLTRTHPGFRRPVAQIEKPGQPNLEAEHARAKKLPEYAELKKFLAERNNLTPAAVARAGELTKHPNVFIRLHAIGVLGNAPEALRPDAVALVAPLLKDDTFDIRVRAMNALAGLNARDRIPELVPLLTSADSDERANARRALQTLGHPGT
jgi:HEAT repeat protein